MSKITDKKTSPKARCSASPGSAELRLNKCLKCGTDQHVTYELLPEGNRVICRGCGERTTFDGHPPVVAKIWNEHNPKYGFSECCQAPRYEAIEDGTFCFKCGCCRKVSSTLDLPNTKSSHGPDKP